VRAAEITAGTFGSMYRQMGQGAEHLVLDSRVIGEGGVIEQDLHGLRRE